MSRILVIGDLHLPCSRKGYLQFCQDLYEQWDCDRVVFIGDVVDLHAISFHQKEPGCPGPKEEYEQAKAAIGIWHKAFPRAVVTVGNHDLRVIRRAKSVDIPQFFIRSYNSIWGTPGWRWVDSYVKDDIYFYHGDGQGGEYPAANAVRKMLMSVVMGHNHTASGVKYYTNPQRRIFACDTGAGCDDRMLAFLYSIQNKRRSVISAAVIIDGVPYVEPMPMGRGEKYHDSNF
ncbi:MAG: hypothetical protein A7316_10230 [Candidatus Altiarchaeales archaeon WOR_SM1_86-2]|nr:MAG: hypothetical protein A7316_10230 [Candidatus Altiarchaeales archaeon WOR_SM1_86-2]